MMTMQTYPSCDVCVHLFLLEILEYYSIRVVVVVVVVR